MAAEIRVDTIKGRAGINTLSFAGDGFSFDKNVGIGTTVVSDPVSANNPGKLAVGIVTCKEVYADGWNVAGIVTATGGFKVGTAATISANGNATYSGIVTAVCLKVGSAHTFAPNGNATISGIATFNGQVNVGTAATFHQNGNVTISGITTLGGTSHLKIPVGTTGQRPGTAQAGDFRYNTTEGQFEGYTDEWGEIGGGGGASETDVAVSSTSATAVYTVAHATYRSAYMIMQITQGSAYQVGRYLVIHDGTTATIVEESAIATGSMLGTFTAGIDGSNLKVYVNMGSASSATVTVLPNPVTV